MGIKNIVLITIGFVALLLGVVGIFLPIMPTTPFVLVSGICFGNSSPMLYKKLLNNKHFGQFLDNYKNKTGITKTVKTRSIVFLWMTLIISAMIFQRTLTNIILLTVGVAVTIHILTIRSR